MMVPLEWISFVKSESTFINLFFISPEIADVACMKHKNIQCKIKTSQKLKWRNPIQHWDLNKTAAIEHFKMPN